MSALKIQLIKYDEFQYKLRWVLFNVVANRYRVQDKTKNRTYDVSRCNQRPFHNAKIVS